MADSGVPSTYWKALFEFAQNAGAGDAVNQEAPEARAMADEDKKWLQEAMSALVKDTDPVRKMKEEIQKIAGVDLFSPSENELETVENSLAMLIDLCEQLDNAKAFHQIGGFRLLRPLLLSPNASFRSEAANLIGELAQNNEYIQAELLKAKVLPLLIELLDHDEDSRVRLKALFAISCFIRSDINVLSTFQELDGLSVVIRSLSKDGTQDRFLNKAYFFLTQLAQKDAPSKAAIIKMGVVEHVVVTLMSHEAADPIGERGLELLSVLTTDSPDAVSECKRPELNLVSRLQFIRTEALNEGEDSSLMECLEYTDQILKRIEG